MTTRTGGKLLHVLNKAGGTVSELPFLVLPCLTLPVLGAVSELYALTNYSLYCRGLISKLKGQQ